MPIFQRILCPVDFDSNSVAALRLAKELAQRDNAKLYLFHSIPPTDPLVVSAPMLAKRTEEEARRELGKIETGELGGVPHELLLRVGHPSEEVITVAKDLRADLIVMATHGRTGIPHLVIGSVAERVVREAPCPVLTVRAHQD